jgi:cardiolipin synthase
MITSLPNLLTLSRVVAVPALIAAFYLAYPISNWVCFVIFTLAAITDFFDGYLARARNEVSRFGRFLDPVADKLLVAGTLLMLVFVDRIDDWTILPAIVILCREILVSGLREFLAELKVRVPVSALAKWKTMMQMFALGFLIVGEAGAHIMPTIEIGAGLLWLAAIVTLYTGYDYLRAGLKHMTAEDSSKAGTGASAD